MHASLATGDLLRILSYLEDSSNELETALDLYDPNPVFRMALYAIKGHLEARVMTPTSLIAASNVPMPPPTGGSGTWSRPV